MAACDRVAPAGWVVAKLLLTSFATVVLLSEAQAVR